MAIAKNFNRVRRLPLRLKIALHHNGSVHSLKWAEDGQYRPQPSLPKLSWMDRPVIPPTERERAPKWDR
jgi:hypothetical protein